jgi:heparosan-N-sulfate-glucuronate 5-epimerase
MLRGHSYWHVDQGMGRAFVPGQLSGYFNDLTAKTQWEGPSDEDGLPLTVFGRKVIPFPTTRLQKALGHWDLAMLQHANRESHLNEFVHIADWAYSSQDQRGGWSVWPLLGVQSCSEYSAMTQGEAVSVLVRAARHTGDARFFEGARLATSLLVSPVSDGGVSRQGRLGLIFEELPHEPPSTVLNGWIFALFGLYDFLLSDRDATIEELLDHSVTQLVSVLPSFDTGYWSHYVQGAAIASPFYHRLHIAQFAAMEAVFPDHAKDLGKFRRNLELQARSKICTARAITKKLMEKIVSPDPIVAR